VVAGNGDSGAACLRDLSGDPLDCARKVAGPASAR